jgi:PadR family transcriptional regulator, regulatory protein PadR
MKTLFRQLLDLRREGPADPVLPSSLSEKEAIVLQLLNDGSEMFGLQMVEASRGALKRGTVYVTLGRMEAKGLVTSRVEERHPSAIGLPRRLYQSTAEGARLLHVFSQAALAFIAAEPVR